MTVNKMISKIQSNKYTIAFILTAINDCLPINESCEIGISYAGEFLFIHKRNGIGFIEHSDYNFKDFLEYLSYFKKNIENVFDKKDELWYYNIVS